MIISEQCHIFINFFFSVVFDDETGKKRPVSAALRSQLDAIDRDRRALKAMISQASTPVTGKLVGGKQSSKLEHLIV